MYDGWRWDYEDEKYSLNKVWQRFELHIEPKVNPYLAHYNFQQCRQTVDATVDDFISRCRLMAQKCKFANEEEVGVRLTEQ